jgi:hypothetical protein
LVEGTADEPRRRFARTNDPGTSNPAMVSTVEVEVAVNDCVESRVVEGVDVWTGIFVWSVRTCWAVTGVATKRAAAAAAPRNLLMLKIPC